MEPRSRWRRRLLLTLGFVVLAVFASSWLARTDRSITTFEAAGTVLIVNDAGPVRVRSLQALGAADDGVEVGGDTSGVTAVATDGVVVRSSDSWLIRRPVVESLSQDGGLVVRVTCPGRLPCRASLEVFVAGGVELTVIAASDMVEVDSFDGALLVVSGDEGVVLGSVAGSVSVISDGPVRGSSLGPTELTIDVVDDEVEIAYLDVPTVLAVSGGAGTISIEVPGDADYAVDIEAASQNVTVDVDDLSERRVSVRSSGAVAVTTTSDG